MPTNLTADLPDVPARASILREQLAEFGMVDADNVQQALVLMGVLYAQVQKARALVEALYNMGEYYHYHGDHLEGQIAVCWQCGATDGHAVGCWVGKAETALAAWKSVQPDQSPE